jgi:hypothetical protein
MRKTSECKNFPYQEKTICYIYINENKEVKEVNPRKVEIEEIQEDLINKKGELYAVWPGNYSSDLFLVDDIDSLFMAYGLAKAKHIHDVEWKIGDFDDKGKRYAYVNCTLKCKCNIDKMGIRQFAADMKEQKGWDVAVSKYGSHTDQYGNTEYGIHVRRSSL